MYVIAITHAGHYSARVKFAAHSRTQKTAHILGHYLNIPESSENMRGECIILVTNVTMNTVGKTLFIVK